MIQRTEVGKQYREYFLEVEKAWNSPEAIMARALQVANRQLDSIKGQLTEANKQLEEAKPKVLFADAVATAKNFNSHWRPRKASPSERYLDRSEQTVRAVEK